MRKATVLAVSILMLMAAAAFPQQPDPKGGPEAPAKLDWVRILREVQSGDAKAAYSALAHAGSISAEVLAADFTRLSNEKSDDFTAAWRACVPMRNLFHNKLIPLLRGDFLQSVVATAQKSAGKLPALNLLVTAGYPAAEAYRAALADADAGIRAEAVSGLGLSFPQPAVLDTLANMMKTDKAPEVRAAIAAILARVGRPRDLEVVVAACADENPSVRAAAVRALLTVRHPAVAQSLASVIADTKEERATRLEAMRPAPAFEHPTLRDALLKALDDEDEHVRCGAYSTLCAAGMPETLAALCGKFTKDPSAIAVGGFVSNCWRFAPNVRYFPDLRRELVSASISALTHTDSRVRSSAANTLRQIPFLEVAEQLGALAAGDASEETKKLVCRALWKNGSAGATAVFVRLLDDESESISKMAALALRDRDDAGIAPAALKLLAGAKKPLQLELVELLAASTDENALKLLRELLQTGSTREKVTVIQGAQRRHNPALCPEIAGLLDGKDHTIRFAASAALGTLRYEPATAKLAELAGKTGDEGSRYLLVKALAEIGTAESVAAVLKHYSGFTPPRQASLAFVLENLTDPKAGEVLAASPENAKIREHVEKSGKTRDPRTEAAMRRSELIAKYQAQSAEELRSLAARALSRTDPRLPADEWQPVAAAMASVAQKDALALFREVTKDYPHWPMLLAAVAGVLKERPIEGGEHVLDSLLRNPGDFVRNCAASALTKTPKGEAVLAAAMESEYRLVSETAFRMLARLGRLPEEKLVKGLADPDWSIREDVARVLAKSTDLDKADWLAAALGNEDPVVRRTIARLLAETRMTALPEALKAALSSDRRTRFWSLRSIAVCGPASVLETYLAEYDVDAAVAAAPSLKEELLVHTAKKLSQPGSSRNVLKTLELIAPGKNRDAEFWQNWLKERKPVFRWSEEDCRFVPEDETVGK